MFRLFIIALSLQANNAALQQALQNPESKQVLSNERINDLIQIALQNFVGASFNVLGTKATDSFTSTISSTTSSTWWHFKNLVRRIRGLEPKRRMVNVGDQTMFADDAEAYMRRLAERSHITLNQDPQNRVIIAGNQPIFEADREAFLQREAQKARTELARPVGEEIVMVGSQPMFKTDYDNYLHQTATRLHEQMARNPQHMPRQDAFVNVNDIMRVLNGIFRSASNTAGPSNINI